MATIMEKYFATVDNTSDHFVERLRKAVAIPSVSADPARRHDVVRMGEWLANELRGLGADVDVRPLGKQAGSEVDLPPIILGRYGSDKNKKTIMVYGHYDVQPASKSDGWESDPFVLTSDDQGRMFGRGSTDDKGPVLAWLNTIESYQNAGIPFPVNLLMCFEGMEESGSIGLEGFINSEAQGYFAETDAICISDSCWLGEKPCLTYGLRGLNYFSVTVSGPAQDLHSGIFGGAVHEPLGDLVHVLASLSDGDGTIKIIGLSEVVAPLTEKETCLYRDIQFTNEDLHSTIGSKTGIFNTTKETLMARWRYPSLSVHGIEGAFSTPGAKTVIPARVTGKFSLRTVPNMTVEQVNELVIQHVREEFQKLNSKNILEISVLQKGKWWLTDPDHWNYVAASKAIEDVWGLKPDLIREGGSIPIALVLEQAIGKNILLLPMGQSTDAAHSPREKINRNN